MRFLMLVVSLLLADTVGAQTCPCPPGDLVYECAGSNAMPAFVIADGVTIEFDAVQQPATYTIIPGTTFSTSIGGAPLVYTVNSSKSSTRFVYDVDGECIGLGNVHWTTFPAGFTIDGRGLQASKSNPFMCHSSAGPTLVCIQVSGQVGKPFPTLPCTADRVEYACGIVS